MTDETESSVLDVREKLAHIDQMLADHDRKRQEIKHAPWLAAFAGMTAGAALFAAGGATGVLLVKLFIVGTTVP
jgi:hypothetical protein